MLLVVVAVLFSVVVLSVEALLLPSLLQATKPIAMASANKLNSFFMIKSFVQLTYKNETQPYSWGKLPVHGSQKFGIILCSPHSFKQFVHSFFGIHICEENPQQVHSL